MARKFNEDLFEDSMFLLCLLFEEACTFCIKNFKKFNPGSILIKIDHFSLPIFAQSAFTVALHEFQAIGSPFFILARNSRETKGPMDDLSVR